MNGLAQQSGRNVAQSGKCFISWLADTRSVDKTFVLTRQSWHMRRNAHFQDAVGKEAAGAETDCGLCHGACAGGAGGPVQDAEGRLSWPCRSAAPGALTTIPLTMRVKYSLAVHMDHQDDHFDKTGCLCSIGPGLFSGIGNSHYQCCVSVCCFCSTHRKRQSEPETQEAEVPTFTPNERPVNPAVEQHVEMACR